MITKKQLVTIVLVCFLLVQNTGCSSFPLPAQSEPVTLRFLHEENAADYAALAQEFNKEHPNITIELVTYKDLGDFYRSYASKMGSADAARLFFGASLYYAQQVPDGLLALDTLIATDEEFPHNDFYPDGVEAMRIEGKVIGLPAGMNPFVVYANPKKFESAGIPLPQAGWTVEDFTRIASAVHNIDSAAQGTDRFAYGFCTDPFANDPAVFLRLFGGALADDENQPIAPMLDQPINETAMTWYTSLFGEFQVTQPFVQSPQTAEQIRAGNCAMWLDVLSAGQYGKPSNMDAIPLPLPVYNNTPVTLAALDNYAILAKSEHPEEAWLWVRFLMEHEQASGTILPARRSHLQSDGFLSSVSPAVAAIARAIPESEITHSAQAHQRLIQANMLYYEAVQQVLKGDADVKTALEQAQQKALKVFGE